MIATLEASLSAPAALAYQIDGSLDSSIDALVADCCPWVNRWTMRPMPSRRACVESRRQTFLRMRRTGKNTGALTTISTITPSPERFVRTSNPRFRYHVRITSPSTAVSVLVAFCDR